MNITATHHRFGAGSSDSAPVPARVSGRPEAGTSGVLNAVNHSGQEPVKSARAMRITVATLAGRKDGARSRSSTAYAVEPVFTGRHIKSNAAGLVSAHRSAFDTVSVGYECMAAVESTCSRIGKSVNGLNTSALDADRQKICNSITSPRDSRVAERIGRTRKLFVGNATATNTGEKICRTIPSFTNPPTDVGKPSLIDLEAPAGATGRKQAVKAGQRERLSEKALETGMRQSDLRYNASLKPERATRRGAPPQEWSVAPRREVTVCMYYSGYETLDIAPSDVMTAAEFDWKQAAVNVSISGLEQLQNAGRERIINLLEKRISNAEKTMRNNLSTGIYSDGTGSGGKQITGLQSLIADDPTTGTVGGIDRSSWSFWRNQKFDTSVEGTGAADASNIKSYMQQLWLDTTRGNDKPDIIVADKNFFQFFWESLTDIQRITSSDEATSGFQSLKFNTADVVYDGDSGIPDNHMYFLNTDYIFWRPHRERNVSPLENKMSVNQDAMVVPVVFAGNMTLSNADVQGVLFD